MEIEQLNFEVKWGRCGQDHPYGDTFRRATIIFKGEAPLEKDILQAVENGKKLPEKEWRNCKSPIEYFTGYYTLTRTAPNTYEYIGVEPYAD